MRKLTSTNHQNKIHLDTACPIDYALARIGTRWKPLILFKLIERKLRFAELKTAIPSISERMLTLSLQEMEKDNLVIRVDNGSFPRKVTYELTPSAIKLNSALQEIYKWGAMDMALQKEQQADLPGESCV